MTHSVYLKRQRGSRQGCLWAGPKWKKASNRISGGKPCPLKGQAVPLPSVLSVCLRVYLFPFLPSFLPPSLLSFLSQHLCFLIVFLCTTPLSHMASRTSLASLLCACLLGSVATANCVLLYVPVHFPESETNGASSSFRPASVMQRPQAFVDQVFIPGSAGCDQKEMASWTKLGEFAHFP